MYAKMNNFRIAVLECDTPIDAVLEKLGSYGTIFELFLKDGLSQHPKRNDITLSVEAYDVVNMAEMPAPDSINAVVLTGSKHNSFDNKSWIERLVEYVANLYEKTQVPIVGICFGHQIIARALGAFVERSPSGWEVSVDRINLTSTGESIFGKDQLVLHQMHRDAVLTLPEKAKNLGASAACGIQGLYIPGRILTLQAHPEFNEFIMKSILDKRHEQKIFDDTLYESGVTRSSLDHDGKLVAGAVCKFLLGS